MGGVDMCIGSHKAARGASCHTRARAAPRAYGRASVRQVLLGVRRSYGGDQGRVRTGIQRICASATASAAPSAICAREDVKSAILRARARGLGRHGERAFDGKAAADASEPWRVRAASAWSVHLHTCLAASSAFWKVRLRSRPADGNGGSRQRRRWWRPAWRKLRWWRRRRRQRRWR